MHAMSRAEPMGPAQPQEGEHSAYAVLLAMLVQAGVDAFHAMMERERSRLCAAPPGATTEPRRRARRAGHASGTLVLAGRRVAIRRARVCLPSGGYAVVQAWHAFADDPLAGTGAREVIVQAARYRDAIPEPRAVGPCPENATVAREEFRALTAIFLAREMRATLGRVKVLSIRVEEVNVEGARLLAAIGVDAHGMYLMSVREDTRALP